jgi:hypothetical protein
MLNRLVSWWRLEPMEGAHYASFYGVPVYFAEDSDGCAMMGRNRLYDLLLLLLPHLHQALVAPFYDMGFPIKVGPRVDGSDVEGGDDADV